MSIYRMGSANVPEDTAIDSYTKLLCHFDGGLADRSGKTLTANGNATASTTQKKFGTHSLSLDGSGDYLNSANSDDFRFGNGDFTIEFWLYSNVAWSSQPTSASICGQKLNDSSSGWVLYRDGGYPTKINARIGLQNNFPTGSTPTQGVWEHWALVRNGTSLKWYKNGVQDASTTSSVNVNDTTGRFLIGLADTWANSYLNGYIDELRISKGIARYTSNFTPQTQPFNVAYVPTNVNVEVNGIYRSYSGVNRQIKQVGRSYNGVNRTVFSSGGIDQNTLLMLHADDFTDSSLNNWGYESNTLTLDTSVKKFGNSSFKCNGGKLIFPANDIWTLSTTDYTIDFWMNMDYVVGDFTNFMGVRDDTKTCWYVGVYYGKLIAGVKNTTGQWQPEILDIATLQADTWYHIAITRSGPNWKIYLNGQLVYSTTSGATIYNTNLSKKLTIGSAFSTSTSYTFYGWLDEIRISNIVRWNSNFTPPTEAYY